MTKAPKMSFPLLPASAGQSSVASLSVSTRQWRRLVARRPRERRGIILIFVVVLLMLLAIMGTAYLASSRADRMALTKNGAIAGTTSPRLADRAKLDALFEAGSRRVQYAIIEDLFNIAPGTLPKIERDSTSNTAGTRKAAAARLAAAFRQEQQPAIAGSGPTADPNRYYKNYDAAGRADPYLSSLLPVVGTNNTGQTLFRGAGQLIWPWISAPLPGEISPGVELAPFFSDPRFLSRTTPATNFGFVGRYGEVAPTNAGVADPRHDSQVTNRLDVPIASVALLRSEKSTNALPSADNTRVYPAFNYAVPTTPASSQEPRSLFIAGDSDGDGIADGGMIPIIINPNANNMVDRYLDQANGVVYFMSYRVVDNSAQLNVNTAMSAKGDFNFVGTPAMGGASLPLKTRFEANAADSPNLGFYKANVGLIELVQNSLEVYGTGTVSAEIDRLVDAHFPNIPGTQEDSPVAGTTTDSVIRRIGLTPNPEHLTENGTVVAKYLTGDRNAPSTVAPAEEWYYRFRSFGDLVEQTLARRTESVGKLRTAVTTLSSGALVSLPLTDSLSFAGGGGSLLNPRTTPAVTENSLLLSTRMAAANFSASTDDTWRWFPADQAGVWYGWTKNFNQTAGDPTTPGANDFGLALLDGATNTRDYDFPGGSGMVPVSMPISIRPLLTTHSGVTAAVPKRYSADAAKVPAGMPDYTAFPAVRASAATGTKEQLWRAYWSVMTQNYVPAGGQIVTYRVDKNLNYPSALGPTSPEVSATNGTGSLQYDNEPQVLADPYQRNYDAFLPPDRYADVVPPDPRTILQTPGSTHEHEQLNADQMSLLRSAVSACNTIDLRDPDNDITAMTIDLGPTVQLFPGNILTGDPADVNYGARNELYARVYGTEKQLVITGVMIDDADGDAAGSGEPNIIVEIFNPTDEVLDLRGYYLAVADRGNTPATGETTETGKIVIDQLGHGPTLPPTMLQSRLMPPLAPGSVTTIEPGGFIIATNLPAVIPPAGSAVTIAAEKPAVHVTATPTTDPLPTAVPPQVTYVTNMLGLAQLQNRSTVAPMNLNRELVLLRTRRADGVAVNENPAIRSNAQQANLPVFNEITINEPGAEVRDLASLVPMDSVDCRSLNYSPDGSGVSRHFYLRSTTPPNYYTANPLAWKAFYAGTTYTLRPDRLVPTNPLPATTPPTQKFPVIQDPLATIRPIDWAWREYPGAFPIAGADTDLGVYRSPDPTLPPPTGPVPPDKNTPTAGQVAIPTPFLAPTIPIQNAKPWTVFDPTAAYTPNATHPDNTGVVAPFVDHPPFQFPYGSPFARDGDLLNVPFIGSYKIYRVNISGGDPATNSAISQPPIRAAGAPPVAGDPELYEFVSLPVDAVNVAPVSADWVLSKNPSVGRFDARPSLVPKNDWAADLFDYVAARKEDGKNLSFPDIPVVKADAANTVNNALDPTTDQDGPVIGYGVFEVNPAAPVSPYPPGFIHPSLKTTWTEWMTDALPKPLQHGTPGGPAMSRGTGIENGGTSSSGTSQLIEGTINLNTAPPIVLRMLPWTVDPADGLLNQGVGPTGVPFNSVVNQAQRARVGIVKNFLENPTATAGTVKTGREHALRSEPPFGFTSPLDLSDLNQLKAFDATVANADPRLVTLDTAAPGPVTNHQYLRMGLLNPRYRSNRENDFNIAHLNMNRVSNLTSQRSDVFTVYVTVQAWTYVDGTNAQQADTRLVGERRGSFIVDRSKISQDHFKPSDLILYPVEQE